MTHPFLENRMKSLQRAALRPLIGLALTGLSLLAQAFPDRPVVLVVPFTPSSGSDIIARILAPKLSERWKQPVVVDNKPGASGNLGAQFVSQAAPDGHTLLMAINTITMTPAIYKNMPYDTVNDFADRKSTRLNSSHIPLSRMPSSA